MLKFDLNGLNAIDKDYKKELKKINNAIPAGLVSVGEDLCEALQQHVEKDVYAKYTPKSYVRTGEMADINNMNVSITGNVLNFEYKFNTESESPYFENSDDVIRAVQDSQYLWDVNNLNIPQRPFWDEFYAEQIGDGKVDISFAFGLNRYDPTLKATPEKNAVTFDGQDSTDLHEAIMNDNKVVWGNTSDKRKD